MTMKKTAALLLALTLTLGAAVPVRGDELVLPDDLYTLGESSESGDIGYAGEQTASPTLFAASRAAAPVTDGAATAYDPRGTGILPPVRDQGAWNTCWVVASIAAAEIGGLKRGLLYTDADETNLSERHLVYFLSHWSEDPLGNSTGDYNTSPSFWIVSGGNPVIAGMTLASWHGAASEAETASPYDGLTSNDTLNESYAYAASLRLKNMILTDLSTAGERGALKDLILTYGGAVVCFYYSMSYLFSGSPSEAAAETAVTDGLSSDVLDAGDADVLDAGDDALFDVLDGAADGAVLTVTDGSADDFTVCYYQNKYTTTSHEVLIVGWDDAYPAENFGFSAAGAVPPGDGAWLCRNSYGGDWAGGDGYFWLSYYDASASYASLTDTSLTQGFGRAAVFDFGAPDEYDNLYEYDGAVIQGYITYASDSDGDRRSISVTGAGEDAARWYANVFTASAAGSNREAERLEAVSTFTYRPGVSYTAEVYLDLADAADPTSGTRAASVSGTFDYPGFHTVELPEAVSLSRGQTYSVVFRVGRSSDSLSYLIVPACYTNDSWHAVNETLTGQSFVSTDGALWYDCVRCVTSTGAARPSNVRVKAYTDTVAAPLPFTDVSPSAWYYSDVADSWYKFLVEGMTDTTYVPAANATRAQLVTTLRRLAGNPAPAIGATAFNDVYKTAWFYEDILWAEGVGLVQGSDDDGDGVYSCRPSSRVTREELVTLLYRFAAIRGVDTTSSADISSFPDSASVSAWAADAVAWAVSTGLLQGVAGGGRTLLAPQMKVSRAQLAVFLNRFSNML